MEELSSNLSKVKERVESAIKRSNRKQDEVTLIAVSKTKPLEMLKEIYDLGVRDFGENKVQELTQKIDAMPQDIRWHMIGHLQTNKVKYIVGRVYMIHSVDSYKLAKEISKEAQKKDVDVNITVEINIADEESKFGQSKDEVIELIKEISTLPRIKVCGLMCVAPFTDNPESNRGYFAELRNLAEKASKEVANIGTLLSMGMSGDFEVAIEEGANFVRVGTSIFGERNYQI